jgi:hypothetical protein
MSSHHLRRADRTIVHVGSDRIFLTPAARDHAHIPRAKSADRLSRLRRDSATSAPGSEADDGDDHEWVCMATPDR